MCLPQATTCPRSSDVTAATWTRRPSPTDRCLSTLSESRKGTLSHFSQHCTTASLLIFRLLKVLCWFIHNVPMFYLTSISIRITHIPQGSLSCVGWTQLPAARRWAKCMVLLRVLSAEMNIEWVNTHTQSGWLRFFGGRQKVPLAGTEKYKHRLQNIDQTRWCRYRQVFCVLAGSQYVGVSCCC